MTGDPAELNYFADFDEACVVFDYFKYQIQFNFEAIGIKIWTDFSSVLSQSMRLTDERTDRQTDKILIARPLLHFMQRGKNAAPQKVGPSD